MKMNQVAVSVGVSVVSGVALSATPASALSLTVDGATYEVIVERTNFNELSSREDFNDLVPWFSDEELAEDLALAAGSGLGLPFSAFGDPSGPFFAIREEEADQSFDGLEVVGVSFFETGDPVRASYLQRLADVSYAVVDTSVTPIPSPALLPGLIGMGLAAMRKRNED